MCLNIDLDKHDIKRCKPVPSVSSYDIVVYKVLVQFASYLDHTIVSPFMYSFVAKDVKGLPKVELISELYVNEDFEVNQGIHSYTSVDMAVTTAIFMPKDGFFSKKNVLVTKCHIPAGSHYYFGVRGDIVSDNLVIDEVLYYLHNVLPHIIFAGRDCDNTLRLFSERPIKRDGCWTSDSICCKISSEVCSYVPLGGVREMWIDFNFEDLISVNQ